MPLLLTYIDARSGQLAGSAGLIEEQQQEAARPGTLLVTGRAYRAQLAEWLAFLAGIKGARSLYRWVPACGTCRSSTLQWLCLGGAWELKIRWCCGMAMVEGVSRACMGHCCHGELRSCHVSTMLRQRELPALSGATHPHPLALPNHPQGP